MSKPSLARISQLTSESIPDFLTYSDIAMILHGYINGTESNCENENNVTVTTSRYFPATTICHLSPSNLQVLKTGSLLVCLSF